MMPSTNGTIENLATIIMQVPKGFQSRLHDLDSSNFMEAMNGEHGEEYREAMGIEMQVLR